MYIQNMLHYKNDAMVYTHSTTPKSIHIFTTLHIYQFLWANMVCTRHIRYIKKLSNSFNTLEEKKQTSTHVCIVFSSFSNSFSKEA